jgi:rhamnose utilization protein RhaD (predicted bifunctional aldolase and dehydrogenase)
MNLHGDKAMPVARPRKRVRWRKVAVFLLLFPFGLIQAGDGLRDCIAQARDSAAMTACEKQAQQSLKQDIKRLTAAIRAKLSESQRMIFDQSTAAWQTFVQHETAMQELTLSQRGDGLGDRLLPGAVTLLYEQREHQLREHLHNLTAKLRNP